MQDQNLTNDAKPDFSVEHVLEPLSQPDLNDLCDATDEAVKHGGDFGWLELPARQLLEAYWQGVITAPTRWLFVARLDGVICGTAQLVLPSSNNEAQKHMADLTTNFVVPWARGHGLARMLLEEVEKAALNNGQSVINLNVREDQDVAIKLYESFGYVQFGAHPYYVHAGEKVVSGRYYYKIIDPKATLQEA